MEGVSEWFRRMCDKHFDPHGSGFDSLALHPNLIDKTIYNCYYSNVYHT